MKVMGMGIEEREDRIRYQAGDLELVRHEDMTVYIDPPTEGTIHISSTQAFLLATFIFGTDPDREPYCCGDSSG
jgi:hypothetical protein